MPKAPAVAKGDGIPAAKRAKAVGGRAVPQISGDDSAVVGEVRYLSPLHAEQAIHKLNGMPLHGSRLSVELAPDSMDRCKLLVHGIPSSAEWQDVKDHFAQIGAVAFANVSGGRKTKTLCGEVRLEDPDVTLQALQMFDGSELMGSPLTVRLDPTSKDKTKLLVSGIPRAAGWQGLKDHFARMRIPVAFCDINRNSAVFAGDTVEAQVRYETPGHAEMAVSWLDGSDLAGFWIQVALDPSSKDGSKLRVAGVNPTTSWQELKDHFAQCGPVAYADVGVSRGASMPVAFRDISRNSAVFAGDTVEAEVRYETPGHAEMAVSWLDGSELAGFWIQVALDPSSKDGSKLRVMGVNPTTSWQELKDHFAQCGPVAYADVGVSKGAGRTKNGGFGGFGGMGEEPNMGSLELSNQTVLVPAAMLQQMISMMNKGNMMAMPKPVKGGGKRKF